MDDFGAGYSVLNMITDIPVDTVKIDGLLIKNCEQGERGIYFLKSLIGLVKGLGYHVICEGVEYTEQVRILKGDRLRRGPGLLVFAAGASCSVRGADVRSRRVRDWGAATCQNRLYQKAVLTGRLR